MDPNATEARTGGGAEPVPQFAAAPAPNSAELIARIDQLSRDAFHMREVEQWDRMLEMAEEARALAESIGYRSGLARAIVVRAFVRYVRSDFQAAMNDCMDAIELSTGHDPEGEGKALGTLAMVNWSVGNYDEALRQVDRALELLENSNDRITYSFGFIIRAGILQSVEQYSEALEWARRGVDAFHSVEYPVGLARALALLGSVHLALGEVEKALALHKESLAIASAANHRFTVSRALSDLGTAWEALKSDDQAFQCHSEALAIRDSLGHRLAATTNLLALGRIYRRRGDTDSAIEALERALSIGEALGARPRTLQANELLARIYEETGRLDLALKHLKSHAALKSELAADRIMLRYRALTLEAQLDSMRNQAELEKMAALGTLVAALAHEINSPLGAIRSSADVSARCADRLAAGSDPRTIEALRANAHTIAAASQRIGELVSRLKSFAGIDQAPYTHLDLRKAVEDAIALLRPEFDGRIDMSVEAEVLARVYVYAAELQQVFMNLLRNAIEAIDGRGKVCIRLWRDDKHFHVAFSDSGHGIPAAELSNLFTPNFRAGAGRVKASLSLFTCRNIVQQHGGAIRVESQPGNGATFIVSLPARLESANPAMEARRAD